MPQAKRTQSRQPKRPSRLAHLLRESGLYVLGAIALYLLVALLSYAPSDPGWSHSGSGARIENLGGTFGAWIADLLLQGFGHIAFVFPVMIGWLAWRVFHSENLSGSPRWVTGLGALLTLLGASGLEHLHFAAAANDLPFVAGGGLGSALGGGLSSTFGHVGATLFLLALFLTGVPLFTGLSWFWVMDWTGEWAFRLFGYLKNGLASLADRAVGVKARRARVDSVKAIRERLNLDEKSSPRIEPMIAPKADSGRLERESQESLELEIKPRVKGGRTALPQLTLLDKAETREQGYTKETLETMSRLLEKKLADFNIDVQVVEVHPGPVITRFEIEPAPGVKASQIVNLSRDLARALSTVSVRVVENIPGKTTVGLEVPNELRETVRLVEGLSSRAYEEANTPLALMLGKDISGVPVIADLCKMPHLLLAGTTGSGKSVCINALILSIVYKSTPEDVRLIMVDPKMLELAVYDGIPHLLAPVVTDMKEAANALRWCIVEMERRYRLMAALGVRNIAGFNRKIKSAEAEGKPVLDPLAPPETEAQPLETLPYVVILIDELADLMIVVGKKVEELITRLAQKGRASGLHLIVATQRPSVDVITGLIKANIPSRIAFQVSSRVDSRTVLDQIGAEHLLGHGDMLYLPPGTSTVTRVHGSFVSDQEVHSVVDALKKSGEPDYEEQVLAGPDPQLLAGTPAASVVNGEDSIEDPESDPLYDQALRIVVESRRASISAVQRHLRVGYNRAARMIEAMEAAGVVGPLQSNGKREVLAPPPPAE